MACPNDPTHLTRLEPSSEGGQQIYCAVCAEFSDPCGQRLGPMEFCRRAKDHGNVHEDRFGNAYVVTVKGITRLSISKDN